PTHLGLAVALHGRAEHVREQLRAEANAEHRLALLERALDYAELRLQVRPPVLIFDVHGTAEDDEAAIAVDLGLRVRVSLEVVEANSMPARANQCVQRSERLDGDVLENQKARHELIVASSGGARLLAAGAVAIDGASPTHLARRARSSLRARAWREVAIRWADDDATVAIEARAVARTVPGLFDVVELHDAAQMGASRGMLVQQPVVVAIRGDLREPAA